jgi:hypothetical protein
VGVDETKDVFLSNFHAMGKLIFAKRVEGGGGREGGTSDGRPPLSFVPEVVVGQCDMGIDSLSAFVQTHCVRHFGDLGELSRALAHFSDADLFIGRIYDVNHARDRGDALYPEAYAESIVGRAVADANVHPHRPGGREGSAFTSPRFFECLRSSRDGLRRLGHLCNDHAQALAQKGMVPARLGAVTMVTEMVPAAKRMGAALGESAAGASEFLRLFNRRCAWGHVGPTPAEGAAEGGGARVEEGDEIVD